MDALESSEPWLQAPPPRPAEPWTGTSDAIGHLVERAEISEPGDAVIRQVSAITSVATQVATELEILEHQAVMLWFASGRRLEDLGKPRGLSRWTVARQWPDAVAQGRVWKWWWTHETQIVDELGKLADWHESHPDALSGQAAEAADDLAAFVRGYESGRNAPWALATTISAVRALNASAMDSPEFIAVRARLTLLIEEWAQHRDRYETGQQ